MRLDRDVPYVGTYRSRDKLFHDNNIDSNIKIEREKGRGEGECKWE